jgi:hypothetical protein
VELLSKAFERLPDDVLMPWLPSLLIGLKPLGQDLVSTLVKEASACFPAKVGALSGWRFPWEESAEERDEEVGAEQGAEAAGGAVGRAPVISLSPEEAGARALLAGNPAATEALAAMLGEAPIWPSAPAASAGSGGKAQGVSIEGAAGEGAQAEAAEPIATKMAPSPSAALLAAYPAAVDALAGLLGASS